MPEITRAADGTQDTMLVRVRTDEGLEGWGESDASPLVCMAAYCCPMSHGNIINIRESLVGERLDGPDDVLRLHAKAIRNGLDIQQIHHAYSAADIALWDLAGKGAGQPVWKFWSRESFQKLPYASVLFESTPDEMVACARRLKERGFRAAKFGWGPFGKKGADHDLALVRGAREGLGPDAEIMVDAGWAFGADVEMALDTARRISKYRITWLEEPFMPDAVSRYGELARRKPGIPLAGGESAGTLRAAEDFIDNAGLGFIQIDVGRIGGITAAREVCARAAERGIVYVNHTFKSKLSVAAAIQVFAGAAAFKYLEYPAAGSELSDTLVTGVLDRGPDGFVEPPRGPGLGVRVNLDVVRKFLTPVRIEVGGKTVLASTEL
jgi:L-alanine-DL-glutamate epimerase-like enolase superfamily enzyme